MHSFYSVQEAWFDPWTWPEHPQLRLRQPTQAWPGLRGGRQELVPLQLWEQLRLPQGRPLHFPQAQQGANLNLFEQLPEVCFFLFINKKICIRFTTGCPSSTTTQLHCPPKCRRRSRSTSPPCQSRSWTPCGWAARARTPPTLRMSAPSSTCPSQASQATSTPTRTPRATSAPSLLFTSPPREVSSTLFALLLCYPKTSIEIKFSSKIDFTEN